MRISSKITNYVNMFELKTKSVVFLSAENYALVKDVVIERLTNG